MRGVTFFQAWNRDAGHAVLDYAGTGSGRKDEHWRRERLCSKIALGGSVFGPNCSICEDQNGTVFVDLQQNNGPKKASLAQDLPVLQYTSLGNLSRIIFNTCQFATLVS